ncbi:MAG: prolipoprotein diacylglyceryl transferase [Acutalibacteraceae bacterium]|nr:prolipoprotein diacylglyceryl transferase [Acutalibacteraceae bacterium]
MFTTIDIFGVELPYYGIMTGLGILACFLLLKFTAKQRKNIEPIEYVCIGLSGGVCAFIMAHLVYGVAQFDKLCYIITHPDRLFESVNMFLIYIFDVFGGMVFYGGLIGACLGGFIYMKRARLDVKEYADTIAPCIPLFHAFGRIGCFLAGCCYGMESKVGFTYHYSMVESANGVCRFPIQLVESAENFILCAILVIILYKCKNIKHGILIWIYGLTYPVIRFINEFFRGDVDERGYFGVLSTSQWISIIIFVLSLIMIVINIRNNNKKENQNVLQEEAII